MNQEEKFRQQRLEKYKQFEERELAKWHRIAEEWGVYPDKTANRCMLCDQNIWFTHDMYGDPYTYTDAEILALITAHVRQVHGNAIGQDQVLDIPGSNDVASVSDSLPNRSVD